MKVIEQKEKNIDTLSSLFILKLKPFLKYSFKSHNEEKMNELVDSIKEQGIIVPILVRPTK